jgi:Zn-dependent peptidase ImmA (M78 family)
VLRADFWQAELRAAEVVAKLRIASLPVDPFAIANGEGIVCEEINSVSPGISGCLMKAGDKFGVFYSSSFPNEGFLRFTVAHELGHYFLDGHYEYIFSGGKSRHQSDAGFTSDDRREREADTFAAGLLMPEKLFRASCARSKPGLTAIEGLAEACGTSLTATAIQYARLSDELVAVVCSKAERVQFAFMSQPLKSRRDLNWIKKNTGLPDGTATARFNRDQSNVAKARRIASTSTLDTWFDGGGDSELVEEVIGLGAYGRTLTVLWGESSPDPHENEDESEEDQRENMLPSDRWRQPRED